MKKIPFTLILIILLVGGFIGFIIYEHDVKGANSYAQMSSAQLADLCLPSEGSVMHIHSHLSITINKKLVTLPAGTGIDEKNNCIKPLHVHQNDNIIHIESPAVKDFTLSDFFSVWGQAFNQNQIMNYQVDQDHGLKFYVDGKESDQFQNTVLKDHQEIYIDYYSLKDGPDPFPQPYPFDNPPAAEED